MSVHVSKGATEALVAKAAKTVLSVPLVTDGVWGDGTAPCSVLDRCAKGQECGIMVVPQASLAAKVKGKTLSYRNQLDKVRASHFAPGLRPSPTGASGSTDAQPSTEASGNACPMARGTEPTSDAAAHR